MGRRQWGIIEEVRCCLLQCANSSGQRGKNGECRKGRRRQKPLQQRAEAPSARTPQRQAQQPRPSAMPRDRNGFEDESILACLSRRRTRPRQDGTGQGQPRPGRNGADVAFGAKNGTTPDREGPKSPTWYAHANYFQIDWESQAKLAPDQHSKKG
jgi:hypothetical protein